MISLVWLIVLHLKCKFVLILKLYSALCNAVTFRHLGRKGSDPLKKMNHKVLVIRTKQIYLI